MTAPLVCESAAALPGELNVCSYSLTKIKQVLNFHNYSLTHPLPNATLSLYDKP